MKDKMRMTLLLSATEKNSSKKREYDITVAQQKGQLNKLPFDSSLASVRAEYCQVMRNES